MLEFSPTASLRSPPIALKLMQPCDLGRTYWTGCEWLNHSPSGFKRHIVKTFFYFSNISPEPLPAPKPRTLPSAPFRYVTKEAVNINLTLSRILDAPFLRDDFYCSTLAYSPVCQTLAVGLGNTLYTWSEESGVRAMHGHPSESIFLSSLAFSSVQGKKCILSGGRNDGSLVLQSTSDILPRFEVRQPFGVSCLNWRPTCTLRPTKNPFNPGVPVHTEDLLVGDDTGTIYYYIVEWPMN